MSSHLLLLASTQATAPPAAPLGLCGGSSPFVCVGSNELCRTHETAIISKPRHVSQHCAEIANVRDECASIALFQIGTGCNLRNASGPLSINSVAGGCNDTKSMEEGVNQLVELGDMDCLIASVSFVGLGANVALFKSGLSGVACCIVFEVINVGLIIADAYFTIRGWIVANELNPLFEQARLAECADFNSRDGKAANHALLLMQNDVESADVLSVVECCVLLCEALLAVFGLHEFINMAANSCHSGKVADENRRRELRRVFSVLKPDDSNAYRRKVAWVATFVNLLLFLLNLGVR